MTTSHDSTTSNGAEEMARMLHVAGRDGVADHYAGKRGWTRFIIGMALDVTVDPVGRSDHWPVTMHNISDGGFAFWSKRRIPLKSRVHLREFSEDNSRYWLPASVTHCTTGIRGYLIGVKLD